MKNNKLTNFEYKILPSKVAGHKQICVTFDYRGDRISRFVFVKESKRTNYYKAARKIIEKEMKDKDLNRYAFWFRDSVHGNRVKAAIVVASLICAAGLGYAGYRVYHYISLPVIQFVKNNTKLINNVTKQEVICSKVEFGTHFEGTISTTNSDYDLPKEIYVTSGDKVLVEDTDYTYDETTGKFTTDVKSESIKIELTPSCNVTSFVFDYPSYCSEAVADNPGFRVIFEDGEDSGYVDWGIGSIEPLPSDRSFVSHVYEKGEIPLKKYTVKIYGKIKVVLFNDIAWLANPEANHFITDIHYGNRISSLNIDEPSTVGLYRAQNVVFDKYSSITDIYFYFYYREEGYKTMNLVLPVNADTITINSSDFSNFVDLKCYSRVPKPGYFVKEVTDHIYVPFGSEDAYKEVIAQSDYPRMASLVTGFNDVLD